MLRRAARVLAAGPGRDQAAHHRDAHPRASPTRAPSDAGAVAAAVRVRRGPRGHHGLPAEATAALGAAHDHGTDPRAAAGPQPRDPGAAARGGDHLPGRARVTTPARSPWSPSAPGCRAARRSTTSRPATRCSPRRSSTSRACAPRSCGASSTTCRRTSDHRRRRRPDVLAVTPARCSAPRSRCGSRRRPNRRCASRSCRSRRASAARSTASWSNLLGVDERDAGRARDRAGDARPGPRAGPGEPAHRRLAPARRGSPRSGRAPSISSSDVSCSSSRTNSTSTARRSDRSSRTPSRPG